MAMQLWVDRFVFLRQLNPCGACYAADEDAIQRMELGITSRRMARQVGRTT